MKAVTKNRKYLLTLMLLAFGGVANAQDTAGLSSDIVFYIMAGFVFIVALLILVTAVVVLRLLKFIVREEAIKKAKEAGVEFEEEPSWWDRFAQKANDYVPIEEENTILLDHNYDGIKELDNHLPPWWKWLFYITIIFAVVYLTGYHVIGNMPLQEEEYQAEVSAANAAALARMDNAPADNIDESNVIFNEDPAAIAQGKQVYSNNCAQCHKELGEGGIGPNLTDDYWLHGGSISEIFTTIKNGVPEKGMISWEPLLSPTQMQNVASYILTLRGSNPPNAKAPQGELYKPESKVEEEVVEVDSLQTAAL